MTSTCVCFGNLSRRRGCCRRFRRRIPEKTRCEMSWASRLPSPRRVPCAASEIVVDDWCTRDTNVRRRNNRLEDGVRMTGTGGDPDTYDTDASTRSSERRSCYSVGTCIRQRLSWLLRGTRHIVLRSRLQLITYPDTMWTYEVKVAYTVFLYISSLLYLTLDIPRCGLFVVSSRLMISSKSARTCSCSSVIRKSKNNKSFSLLIVRSRSGL